jgi:PleD family two-component response regulator
VFRNFQVMAKANTFDSKLQEEMAKPEYKILAVDDDDSILELLKYNLDKAGYEVKTASDGEQAIEIARRFRPNLVLLDIMTVSYTHLTLPTSP